MIDSHSQELLQNLLRRESRSVLMYVTEAYPWTSSTETQTLRQLHELILEERDAVTHLGQFLVRHRVPLPFLPSFPSQFTTINFLALDFILPRLIEYERHSIGEIERDLAEVKDSAGHREMEKILILKRHHLSKLEALAACHPQATAS